MKFIANYYFLSDSYTEHIRKYYTVINVKYIDKMLIDCKMTNGYTEQEKVDVNNILDFCLKSKDKHIFKKTDYLCNDTKKICICNENADAFRRIYDGDNYSGEKFILFLRDVNDK